MPSQGRHLAQAEHNEALFELLGQVAPSFVDWQITTLFYGALHYIEAYLATAGPAGIHLENHQQRSGYVARDAFLRSSFVDYQELKDRSEDAQLIQFDATFAERLKNTRYLRIKDSVRRRLGT